MGLEMQMDHSPPARPRAHPSRPDRRRRLRDLVEPPLGTVERLYAGWDLPVTAGFRATLEAYLAARHTGPRRGARLLLRRHRPRPGHPPGPGLALPGALRGPVRGLSETLPEVGPGAVGQRFTAEGRPYGLETRDAGGPGGRRRPGQGLLRRRPSASTSTWTTVPARTSGWCSLTPTGSGCSISLMKNEAGGRDAAGAAARRAGHRRGPAPARRRWRRTHRVVPLRRRRADRRP